MAQDQEKQMASLNLINHQPDIDKICLYVKDPFQARYQFLIKKLWRSWSGSFKYPYASINTQAIYLMSTTILKIKSISNKNTLSQL